MKRRRVTAWDRLTPPAEDGAVLAVPPLAEWGRLAEENRHARRRRRGELLGRPWAAWTEEDPADPPVIRTGHQPGFIHPGVWIKAVGIGRAAARVGGRAEFVLADTDAADDLALAVPHADGRRLEALACRPPGVAAGEPYRRLPPIPPSWWEEIDRTLHRLPPPVPPDAPWAAFTAGYLAGPGEPSLPAGHGPNWAAGLRAAQDALGLPSPAFRSAADLFDPAAAGAMNPAWAFVAHLLLEAGPLAAAYNEAVHAYRARRGWRGRMHPVPDLAVATDRVETPFWVAPPRGPRQRLWVGRPRSDRLELWAGRTPLGVLAVDALRQDPRPAIAQGLPPGTAIWPRALALTMFLRLFHCDLFVQGVGGAKYDQMTDAILRRFFGIDPPAYVALSATLRLPLPRSGRTADELERCRRRLRDLRFNPQRCRPVGRDAAWTELVRHREALIARSERLRHERQRAKAARRAVWDEIHEVNRRLAARLADEEAQVLEEMAEIHRAVSSDRLAASREWFFALHSGERLRELNAALEPGR